MELEISKENNRQILIGILLLLIAGILVGIGIRRLNG